MKLYNVKLTYPIQVKAEDKEHVREMIMENEHLGTIPNLELDIKEAKNESKSN
ncbi:MAG: hypothetical protein H8E55_02160 [Pelagibacterales bacterium]|nr:hypothetical protein [Pelagibacterales bacterium]